MNLPIINAAAEGTVSVAVIFAATAYFGKRENLNLGWDVWYSKLPWFFDLQIN